MNLIELLSLKIGSLFLHPYEEMDKSMKVRDAISYMQIRETSSIILSENKKAIGIFTERDLCKNFEKINLGDEVSLYMTKNPISVNKECLLGEAMGIMQAKGLRHLVIEDENSEVIGILSMRDIITCVMDQLSDDEADKFLLNIQNKI